jgi:hypothetical protein
MPTTISETLVPTPPPLPPSPPDKPRVSVADRVARSFPPLACVRGYRYFHRKRVELVSMSENAVEADVKGKRTLHVTLRVADGRLSSGCTCSAKLLGPAACRHVWATLLEVDRRGAFERLRTTARALTLGPPAVEGKPARAPRGSKPAKHARAKAARKASS